jgi:hypothetical protein
VNKTFVMPVKVPGEIEFYGVDWSDRLDGDTIVDFTVDITLLNGTDPNVAAMIAATEVDGSITKVKIINGVVNAIYLIAFWVDLSSGRKKPSFGVLRVVETKA